MWCKSTQLYYGTTSVCANGDSVQVCTWGCLSLPWKHNTKVRDHTSSSTATVLILDRAGKKNGNNCSNWNCGGCVSRAECTAITWFGAEPQHQHCCSCSMGLQRSLSKQDSGFPSLAKMVVYTETGNCVKRHGACPNMRTEARPQAEELNCCPHMHQTAKRYDAPSERYFLPG